MIFFPHGNLRNLGENFHKYIFVISFSYLILFFINFHSYLTILLLQGVYVFYQVEYPLTASLKHTSHSSCFKELLLLIPKEKKGNLTFIHGLGLPLPVCDAVSSCDHPLWRDDGPTTDMLLPSFQRHLNCKDLKWEQVKVLGSPQTWRLSIFWKIDPDIFFINVRNHGLGRSKTHPTIAQKKRSSAGSRKFPTLAHRRGS